MANSDGFNSSEMMYPAVTTGEAPQPIMHVAQFPAAAPAVGGPSRGPELLHGGFNQTWLVNCLRRRWVSAMLLGMLFAFAAALLLLWLFPLSSSITALVHVQQEQEDLMNKKERFSPQELEVFQETQAALIKSQFVLQSALNRRDISQLQAVIKEEPDPITWLQDELFVGFQGETLMLRYDGEEDSEEMKRIVDAILDAYENEVVGKDRIRSGEMKENLAKLHRELDKELSEKIEKYNTLSEEIGGAESPIAQSVLSMLINEVREIQRQILDKKQELVEISITRAVAEQQATSPAALEAAVKEALADDPMLESYRAEEFAITQQLRAQKAAAKQGTSAQIKRLENTLRALQIELDSYRRQAEQELRKEFKSAPNDMLDTLMTEYRLRYVNITNEIAELEAKYEEKVAEIEQKGVRNGELAMLESEIEQLQEIESEMEFKLRSWKIQDQAAEDQFIVLQKATALEKINTWQRYTLAGLGAIAAFCATCYGVALVEFRRRRLNSASDMDEGLGLRVLGVLPPVTSRKAMAPGSMLAAQLAESIDNVRATLMHDSTSRKRQVVLVTSPETMEGTTTVASHLALSLARAGRRTLLVDGDVREPSLHKLFGMPLEDGFCELLRSDIDIADAIRPTNSEGLWLLSAGHCDMDAIHALATDQPQPIFEKLREEFDFIIIDGAPVLGLSDTVSIGQHVDGAILTVLRDHSEVRKVYQAMELMKSMGIRLIGSVVNGIPLKADRRIARLHKNEAKQPRKLPAAKKTEKSKTEAKPESPAVNLDDFEASSDEVDLDFDDLGLEGLDK